MQKDKEYYINKILNIYKKDKINYVRIIQKDQQLTTFIINNTPLLNDNCYKFITRVIWIINNITDFPTCPTCNKKFGYGINLSITRLYNIYCSKKCCDTNKDRKQKIRLSVIKKGKETGKKIKETCMQKYGVENVSQIPEVKLKQQNTLKTTLNNPIKKVAIFNKRKQTSLKKYGCQHYSKTKEFKQYISNKLKNDIQFKQKLNNIRLQKYGTKSVFNIKSVREKLIKCKNDKAYKTILSWNQYVIPLFTREEYVSRSYKKIYKWKCVKCGLEFQQSIGKCTNNFQLSSYIPVCPNCYPKHLNYSKKEKQLVTFCKEFYPNLIQNDRKFIYPLEVDIRIPQLNLAIEFNGIFWHSIQKKPKYYHLIKTQLCEKNNYRLIHIWEDDWNNNKELIKEKLKNIFLKKQNLNISDQFILNREWYQYQNIQGYICQILQPKIVKHQNINIENCGYLKYTKIRKE